MAYRFSAGYLITNTAGLPPVQAAKTVVTRVLFDSISTLQTLINCVDATNSVGYQLGVRTSTINLWSYGGTSLISSSTGLVANQWQSIAYTFDGSTHALYVDGAQVATSTLAPQTGTPSATQLGGNQWNENLAGMMEDSRIYSRALSPAEISTLHLGGSIVEGLVAWWPFNDQPKAVAFSNPKEVIGNKQHTLSGTSPIPQESFVLREPRYRL